MKELVAYTGFYVEKAARDAILVGLPLSLHNFIYSGGRTGETGRSHYQKRVLNQQFCHEWATVENREKKGCSYSSDFKVQKRETAELPMHLKRKKKWYEQTKHTQS